MLPAPSGAPVVESGWELVWRGHTWREADLTGQHLSVLSLLSGSDDYETLDLDPRHGHQRLMMMLAAFEATRGLDEADVEEVADTIARAQKQIAEASADEILGALKLW